MTKLGCGITNRQAKYLAALCRETKVPYMGRGMTRDEASIAIDALKENVGKKQAAQRRNLEKRL